MNWPNSLVDQVARRRFVLYVGAGASAGALSLDKSRRPPTWEAFLKLALGRCDGSTLQIRKYLKAKDYLTAAELLKNRLGDEWYELMADEFTRPRYGETEVHRLLFQLDSRLVLTPNFDKIFDTYVQAETHGATHVKQYWDNDLAKSMRGNYRAVVKVHGTIDEPTRTVFTRSDYAKLRVDHPAFQSLIDALFLTNTFLFVGSSLSDPDLKLFLERHAYAHPSAPAHFIVTPKTEVNSEIMGLIKSNYNLQCITYSPINHHAELTKILGDLVNLVEASRLEIQRTAGW